MALCSNWTKGKGKGLATADPVLVIPKGQVEQLCEELLAWNPKLEEQAAFEMEVVREACIFASGYHKECKVRAFALSKTIASLSAVRMHLECGHPFEDVKYVANYDRVNSLVLPMQQKLNESLTFQRGNLLRKIGEFTDATSWLKNVIENTNACAAYQTYFLGAYAVLSDMLVHLKFRHSESERGLQLSLNCSGGESQVEVD